MPTCNVVINDKHPVDSLGLSQFLEDTEFLVLKNLDSVLQLVEFVANHPVDLVLSEIDMPQALKLPTLLSDNGLNTHVVYFSSNRNPVLLNEAKKLNCAGALNKNIGATELLQALRDVLRKGSCWNRMTTRRIVGALSAARVDIGHEAALTLREYSILENVSQGKTNQKIADEMGISYETVKEHVQNVLKKLHLTDRTQAAIWLVRHQQNHPTAD